MRVRLAGIAGVAGGLTWVALVVLWFAVDRGATLLGYGTLDALAPVAFALALAGLAGYRAETRPAWGRLAVTGFAAFAVGLAVAFAGSLAYVVGDVLAGWTLSVWSYFLALVGATLFGVGLLWAGVPPRTGGALLAATLPLGVAGSLALAVGGVVTDEAVLPVGPGALVGAGIAVLSWWMWRENREARVKMSLF